MKIFKGLPDFDILKTRILNNLDIRLYRNGVLAAFVSTIIAASSCLVGCNSDKFASSSVSPESTMNLESPGVEIKKDNAIDSENGTLQEDLKDAEDNIEPIDTEDMVLPSSSPILYKYNVDLTNPTVVFKDISTNIKNHNVDIVEALEGQKLELNFEKLDMNYASFSYPSALCPATKKEMSQIKEVIKEEVFDDYKVIAYEDTSGGFYLGYIKDNVLYCLDSFESDMKHLFDSIRFTQFEKVLGAEKGFVVYCSMGASYGQYVYYGIYNGVPQVLTYCYSIIKEVDLDGDGMKEIIFSHSMPRYTRIQVKKGNDVYLCRVNEDIDSKIYSLTGLSLGTCCVDYIEDKNVFEISVGREMMEGCIRGYAIW